MISRERIGPHSLGTESSVDTLARARGGDAGAFAELVRQHAPMAKRVATVLGAGADVDDVVQEAFVKAYGSMHRFRADASFRPWLLRIGANETHNQRRARLRRATREQRWGNWGDDLRAAGAEVLALDTIRDEQLLAAVGGLPDGLRRVVCCRYLLELSESETAVVLGVPAGTVKSRLHRGLARLRQTLREEVADEPS